MPRFSLDELFRGFTLVAVGITLMFAPLYLVYFGSAAIILAFLAWLLSGAAIGAGLHAHTYLLHHAVRTDHRCNKLKNRRQPTDAENVRTYWLRSSSGDQPKIKALPPMIAGWAFILDHRPKRRSQKRTPARCGSAGAGV
jgi:hypothetical protein